MVKLGYFLSCEEFDAPGLVRQAKLAEDHGFEAGTKVCFGPDEDEARRTAHRIWRNEGLPGELAQVLPTPEHFHQAASMVEPDDLITPVGPDPDVHVTALRQFLDVGYDELYVQQIGPDQDAFFDFYGSKVLPQLR